MSYNIKFNIYDNEETKYFDINSIDDYKECIKEGVELVKNSYSDPIYIKDDSKSGWIYHPNYDYAK